MRGILRAAGILFLLLGLIWIVYVMGMVLSRTPEYMTLNGLAGAVAFHTVSMALGAFCLGKAAAMGPAKAGEVAPAAH